MSIPTLSLIVAALAVFFGPMISLWIAKRQIASSAEVANKQITAPMRQAWINSLRDLVAEITSDALHYFTAGHDFEGYKNLQRLTFLESKIQLMLNPNEPDHQRLEWMIREMMEGLQESGKDAGRKKFIDTHPEVTKLCRQVLKREWNRVKDKIELPDQAELQGRLDLGHLTIIAAMVLVLVVVAVGTLRFLNHSKYTLTSFKRQATTETITLDHEGHTIQAECSSACDEFGTMVGQHLFCFTEAAPSDASHPYGTKRPVFNATGGAFVCRNDGETGPLFMVRGYKCFQMGPEDSSEHAKLTNEYPEDALFMPVAELNKLYCKAGEVLVDQGGDIVAENGKVLPLIRGQGHTELLNIVGVK